MINKANFSSVKNIHTVLFLLDTNYWTYAVYTPELKAMGVYCQFIWICCKKHPTIVGHSTMK